MYLSSSSIVLFSSFISFLSFSLALALLALGINVAGLQRELAVSELRSFNESYLLEIHLS